MMCQLNEKASRDHCKNFNQIKEVPCEVVKNNKQRVVQVPKDSERTWRKMEEMT